MEDPKAAAERLHTALFGKNRDETCLDIVINNDLEHRLLIAKKYGELFSILYMKTWNQNLVETSKNYVDTAF